MCSVQLRCTQVQLLYSPQSQSISQIKKKKPMNLWAFIKQTPKLLMPYVQIRHTHIQPTSSSFLFSFTDVGRVSLPLELLSFQSCLQDSMLTFFFFSDTCWGTLSPSLHSEILKFSSSHTKQKINILDSQLEPCAIVL